MFFILMLNVERKTINDALTTFELSRNKKSKGIEFNVKGQVEMEAIVFKV